MEMKSVWAFGLLLASSITQAAPLLFFNGSFNFDSSSQTLSVDATLSGSSQTSQDITIPGSSFTLTTLFNDAQNNGHAVEGSFGSLGNGTSDFAIVNGIDTTLLLGGDIQSLMMSGLRGNDLGLLSGNLLANEGSLLADFYPEASLFSLQFNLDSVFSSDMFDRDLSGQINGNITGITNIPEPATLTLLSLGLLGLFYSRRIQK